MSLNPAVLGVTAPLPGTLDIAEPYPERVCVLGGVERSSSLLLAEAMAEVLGLVGQARRPLKLVRVQRAAGLVPALRLRYRELSKRLIVAGREILDIESRLSALSANTGDYRGPEGRAAMAQPIATLQSLWASLQYAQTIKCRGRKCNVKVVLKYSHTIRNVDILKEQRTTT